MLKLFIASWGLTAFLPAAELSWADLVSRPDLWPAQCSVTQAMKLQGDHNLEAGQKLTVLELREKVVEVSLTDGKTAFSAAPEATDVLTVARATYDALTPQQRELTYGAVIQRKELWPYRVTLNRSFELGKGASLQQGGQLRVMGASPVALALLAENVNVVFNIVPQATDFMALARKFLEDPQAGPRFAVMAREMDEKVKAEGSVLAELDGKLVNSVTDQPQPFDGAALPRYILFYRGSSLSPFTKGFTPTLVKYYNEVKPRHPEFEIVYLMTESAAATGKFATKMGFSWRAVSLENIATVPAVARFIGARLPQLIVVDRSGNVLVNGIEVDSLAALRRFDVLLNQPAAPN
jgi:hypothetical protein